MLVHSDNESLTATLLPWILSEVPHELHPVQLGMLLCRASPSTLQSSEVQSVIKQRLDGELILSMLKYGALGGSLSQLLKDTQGATSTPLAISFASQHALRTAWQ